MNKITDSQKELRDIILEKAEAGKVVLWTIEGLAEIDLDELVAQPTSGLLYDLNRDSATVLTFIDDPKWVNDYAVGLVITRLKEMVGK